MRFRVIIWVALETVLMDVGHKELVLDVHLLFSTLIFRVPRNPNPIKGCLVLLPASKRVEPSFLDL
jgi:hypothetical protein